MPFELNRLREQLSALKDVYKDAILNGSSYEEKNKIEQQIEKLEMLIADRKQLIERTQSPD
jgi:hypothetical protein